MVRITPLKGNSNLRGRTRSPWFWVMDQPPPPESTLKTTKQNMPIGSMTGVFTCMQTIKNQPSIPLDLAWDDGMLFLCGGRSKLKATCILFWSQIARSLLDLLGNWSTFPPEMVLVGGKFRIRESHRKDARFYSGLQGGPLVDSCKWSYKFYKCWSYRRVTPMNGVIILLLITW